MAMRAPGGAHAAEPDRERGAADELPEGVVVEAAEQHVDLRPAHDVGDRSNLGPMLAPDERVGVRLDRGRERAELAQVPEIAVEQPAGRLGVRRKAPPALARSK